MTIIKLGIRALTSALLVGGFANDVAAANLTQEDCERALYRQVRQICTPQTTEDVLKTTWPGGTNLGAPCYAAADAYYAAIIGASSEPSVVSASARFCEHAGLGLDRTE